MRLARARSVGPRGGRRVSLLWWLFAGNAAVVIAAAAVLAFSPATIHATITSDELLGLLGGLAVVLIADLLFLRVALAPLRRLAALMGSVDPLRPGRRIGDVGRTGREVELVAEAFDAMLERLEAERRASARRALAAQEGERLRVARELHDELGQTLTAAALRAEGAAAADGAQAQALTEIAQVLQQSLGEVRRIARELRPEALDDLGLVNAVITLCTRVASHAGTWIEREFAADLPALGSEADLVVYRVAQEALTNALRHGQATRITVALTRDGDDVVLRVRDDGCGLPEPLREGNGIAGMRERAMLIGARLELHGAPDHGAEVRLAVTASARSDPS
jgi:two-component system, NarL family, sensor histidine kinase UhpB